MLPLIPRNEGVKHMAATTQPIAIASDVSEAQPAGSTVVLVIGWVAASLFIVLPIVTTSVAVTLGVLLIRRGRRWNGAAMIATMRGTDSADPCRRSQLRRLSAPPRRTARDCESEAPAPRDERLASVP